MTTGERLGKRLGRNVTSALNEKNMKLTALQRKTGVSYKALWNLRHGKLIRVDLDILGRVSRALGVRVTDLVN